jgi:hypothetical protein
MMEKTTKKGKEVTINGNGFGVGLESKNSKVQLGKVKVVVCANKMAHP